MGASKCLVCGNDASPEFFCVKKDMRVSLCEEHADECLDCDVEKCERSQSQG